MMNKLYLLQLLLLGFFYKKICAVSNEGLGQLPSEIKNHIAYYIGHEDFNDFKQRVLFEASTKKKQDHYLKWTQDDEVAIMEKTNTCTWLSAALCSLFYGAVESFIDEDEIALWKKKVLSCRRYDFYNTTKNILCCNRNNEGKDLILSVFDLQSEKELVSDLILDQYLLEPSEKCIISGVEFSRDCKKMVICYRNKSHSAGMLVAALFSLKGKPKLVSQTLFDVNGIARDSKEYTALNDQATRLGLAYTLKEHQGFKSYPLVEDTCEEPDPAKNYMEEWTHYRLCKSLMP